MKRRTPPKKQIHHRVKRVAKSTVVPHAHNDYRPHLIRWPSLLLLIFAIIAFQLCYNFFKTGSVLGQSTEIIAGQLLEATNQERRAYGESPLRVSTQLSNAAAMKADDMFAQQYWAHVAPDGTTPWQWFDRIGYDYSSAGENLAKGFHSSAGVVTAWMNSDDHKDNVLNTSYSEVGFAIRSGVLNGEETTVVVALYGAPKSAVAASAASSETVLAAQDESLSLISRIGIGIQSMTPALLGSIVLFGLLTTVALVAHAYRKRLPYAFQKSWRRHHGLFKAIGMSSLVVVLVALYGGGQI